MYTALPLRPRAVVASEPQDHAEATVNTALFLFGVALAVRILFLALSDNEDGDAFARVLWARAVVDAKAWNPTEDWLPGHFWVLAAPYALGLQRQIWARLLTAAAGAATVPMLYLLTRRTAGAAAAAPVALLLALNPLHIRFSVVTVSEAFFVFFVAAGLWAFVAYRSDGATRHLVLGALALNLASAQRMEGWLLLPALAATAVFRDSVTRERATRGEAGRVVLFTLASGIFVLAWTSFSWWTWGDPVHTASVAAHFNTAYRAAHPLNLWYTAAFWPVVIVAAFGPTNALIGARSAAVTVAKGPQRFASVLFVAFLAIYYVQAFRTATITQARYGVLLVLLLLFASASAFARHAARHGYGRLVGGAVAWLAIVCIVAAAPLGSLSAKMRSVTPIPRHEPAIRAVDGWLRDQTAVGQLVLGPLPAYSPWLSRLDDWYPRGAPQVVRSAAELARATSAGRAGHLILRAGSEDALALFSGATKLHVEQALSVPPYVVYRWRTE